MGSSVSFSRAYPTAAGVVDGVDLATQAELNALSALAWLKSQVFS